ncbi:MAG TPA: phosphoglycerate kinase [Candidatus Acidoferrales bacterium]|nr:phosphoglycerate kinase [Candidatus Acidoferrales bacterium]
MPPFLTMDDLDTHGRVVLVRVDLNSPIGPDGEILDDVRFRGHIPTIEALDDAKTVLLAHQSRPGKRDFTTMEQHGKKLASLLGKDVIYVDSIYGQTVRNSIQDLRAGQVLLLENVRFSSEEMLKAPVEDLAKTHLVTQLSLLCDLYLNDAFGTAHRAQTSIVAFPRVLTSGAGKLMEQEVKMLTKALTTSQRPRVFMLGGTKADDSIKVIEHVLSNGKADEVLVAGLVANIFLAASGIDIGRPNLDYIKSSGYEDYVELCRRVLDNYGEKITTPLDVALSDGGKRLETPISALPKAYPIYDIGVETIVAYSTELKAAGTVVINGPAGVFEQKAFALGTNETLKAAARAKFSILGGGHIAAAARNIGIDKYISHISTGGKACIDFLAGESLPGIQALVEASDSE